MWTRRRLLTLIAGTAVVGIAAPALSQSLSWPQRRVRLIVPFPPGGLTDGIARLIGQRLSESLGRPFVLENMGGAAGAIAAGTVARAPADGYTLLLASLTQFGVLPALEDVAYDPTRDFAPISNIASAPFVLMVNAAVPAHTVKEFVDYVRLRPGQVTYASSGVGSLAHLSMALFLKRAGVDMVHVPYKGGAPAITDLMAGHVAAYFGTRTDAVQQFQSGMIRLLAVSDDKRSTQFPDVPTVSASGYPGFRTTTWNGLAAPAKTPAAIIDTLADEVRRAIANEPFVRSLHQIGVDPIGDGPQAFAATIAADVPLWAEAVRVAGAKSQ
jgi:tripartite-type tricarboxylate transporter receptor subunit TctC